MLGKRFYVDFVQQLDRSDKEHWWKSFFVYVDSSSLTFLSNPSNEQSPILMVATTGSY